MRSETDSRAVKRVLVSGATGFLGKHLVAELSGSADTLVFTLGRRHAALPGVREHFICDLTSGPQIASVLRRTRPDSVYHLAGSSQVSDKIGMPDYFANNFLTTVAIADALAESQTSCRLFFASSVHVYGNATGKVAETAPPCPASFYGFSKYLAENYLAREFKKAPHLSVTVGRLYSCIGPGQSPGFVASDLCARVRELPSHGEPTLKTGPLNAYRRFSDVRDVARLLPRLLEKTEATGWHVFNIASPYGLTVREMLDRLLALAGKRAKVDAAPGSANPFQGLEPDVSRLKALLPDFAFRPLDETLSDMLAS